MHIEFKDSSVLDAEAQPVAVGEEKGLSRESSNVPLISADDEMYEEKEEKPVNVIKDKAKLKLSGATAHKGRAYCAHPSIRDHWALRCMNRSLDKVVSLKRDFQCLSPQV
ncbi:UNVERIFIED_CONTAM: hypothetical protein NCL1_35732 [Trichonephila clavipes]